MALAGPGVTFSGRPREGKIQLKAAYHGLFKVNVDPLIDFNMISEVMCASIHNNTPGEHYRFVNELRCSVKKKGNYSGEIILQ